MRIFRARKPPSETRQPASGESVPSGVFTYRVQVERAQGGWADLRERTGAPACHGVVEVGERDLVGVATQAMERLGGTWAGCRVVFFLGDRLLEPAADDSDVYAMVGLGESRLVPGPAHRDSGPPAPSADADHSRADRLREGQTVECGACREKITVRPVPERTLVLSTPDPLRGTALMCRRCSRLFCVDCVFPLIEIPSEAQRPQCDRCGGVVGSIGEHSSEITIQGTRRQTPPAAPTVAQVNRPTGPDARLESLPSYAGLAAAEIVDRVAECRRAGRAEDADIRRILVLLRQDYGHPSYPFAASLERLAFGTSGPALFQESMEPGEIDIITAVMRRISDVRRD